MIRRRPFCKGIILGPQERVFGTSTSNRMYANCLHRRYSSVTFLLLLMITLAVGSHAPKDALDSNSTKDGK